MNRFIPLYAIFILSTIIIFTPNMYINDIESIASSYEQYSPQSSSNSEISGFSENKHLSTTDSNYDHHVEPTLAISDNGTLFAGWKNSETAIGGGARVSFVKSIDGGEHWTHPFDMPMFNIPFPQNQFGLSSDQTAITRQSDPWLIWHSDLLYYAYLEFSLDVPEFSQITVARSNDSGNTWVPVSASFGRGFADKETMWVHSDGTIYVAYDDIDIQGNVTLQVTRSTNNGESFSEIGIVGYPDPEHLAPYVTTNNAGHVYITSTFFVQDRGTLILSRSEDMGETFDDPRVINRGYYSDFTSVNGRPSKGTIPVLRFDQNERLYVLWADTYEPLDHSFDIYLRYSDDYGETWSNRYLINPVEEGDQWQPDMDIDSEGNLHIVYYDERDEFYRPYYRRIQFTGESKNESLMSEPIAIADTNTSSEFTRPGDYFTIRVDSDDIPHVVWTDGRHDEMDIYYAYGIRPIPTTPATTTTPTTTYTPTNTTEFLDTSTPQIFIGLGTGLMLVCIVVVIIYYRTKY